MASGSVCPFDIRAIPEVYGKYRDHPSWFENILEQLRSEDLTVKVTKNKKDESKQYVEFMRKNGHDVVGADIYFPAVTTGFAHALTVGNYYPKDVEMRPYEFQKKKDPTAFDKQTLDACQIEIQFGELPSNREDKDQRTIDHELNPTLKWVADKFEGPRQKEVPHGTSPPNSIKRIYARAAWDKPGVIDNLRASFLQDQTTNYIEYVSKGVPIEDLEPEKREEALKEIDAKAFEKFLQKFSGILRHARDPSSTKDGPRNPARPRSGKVAWYPYVGYDRVTPDVIARRVAIGDVSYRTEVDPDTGLEVIDGATGEPLLKAVPFSPDDPSTWNDMERAENARRDRAVELANPTLGEKELAEAKHDSHIFFNPIPVYDTDGTLVNPYVYRIPDNSLVVIQMSLRVNTKIEPGFMGSIVSVQLIRVPQYGGARAPLMDRPTIDISSVSTPLSHSRPLPDSHEWSTKSITRRAIGVKIEEISDHELARMPLPAGRVSEAFAAPPRAAIGSSSSKPPATEVTSTEPRVTEATSAEPRVTEATSAEPADEDMGDGGAEGTDTEAAEEEEEEEAAVAAAVSAKPRKQGKKRQSEEADPESQPATKRRPQKQ